MPESFSVRFERLELLPSAGRVTSTFDTLRLDLSRVGAGDIPVIAEADAAPTAPQVWLQIWSRGRIEPRRYGPGGAGGHVPTLDLDPTKKNQDRLCASIGGYVQHKGAAYRFVAVEVPARGPGPQRGWMHLAVDGVEGARSLGIEGSRVPLVSDREDEWVVIAAALTTSPGTEPTKPTLGPSFTLVHLTHILGAQLLDDGGLTLCMHVVIPNAGQNDKAFLAYGPWVAQRLHGLALGAHGELVVGSTGFNSTPDSDGDAQILETLKQVRRAAGALVPGLGEDPKVARLVLLTHGDTADPQTPKGGVAVLMGHKPSEDWLGVGGERFTTFVEGLGRHLAPRAIVTLCCCWVGAPPNCKKKVRETQETREVKDKDGNVTKQTYTVTEWVGDYCKIATTPEMRRKVGVGSFADHLCRRLNEQAGLGDVAVWGHTSKGDALWNMQLRAFTRHGNMDLCYMALGPPWRPGGMTLTDSNGKDWTNRFIDQAAPKLSYLRPGVWRALDASFRHPGALVEALLQDSPPERADGTQPLLLRPGETLPVGPWDDVVVRLEARPAAEDAARGDAQLIGIPTTNPATQAAFDPETSSKPAPPTSKIVPTDADLGGFAFIRELTRRYLTRPPLPGALPARLAPAVREELEALREEVLRERDRWLLDIIGVPKGHPLAHEPVRAHELRDYAILAQLKAGNMPDFCRPDLAEAWHAVPLDHPNKQISGIVYVLSDVLAVGNNEDYVRVPISGYASQLIADHWGCCLPTSRVVRQAYHAAAHRMVAHNFGPGMLTMSNDALLWHDAIVQGRVRSLVGDPPDDGTLERAINQASRRLSLNFRYEDLVRCRVHDGRCHCPRRHPGTLVVGHKKEVVVSRVQDRVVGPDTGRPLLVPGSKPPAERLKPNSTHKRGRSLSFIGFFDSTGTPMDRLITPDHGPGFKDYAQGTRLVHPTMHVRDLSKGPTYIEMNYVDVLRDAVLYRLAVDHPHPRAQTGIPWGTPGIPKNDANGEYVDIGPIDWPRYPAPDEPGKWST